MEVAIRMASAPSEVIYWECDSFRSLGPIRADSRPSEIADVLGPLSRQKPTESPPGSIKGYGWVRILYLDEQPYIEVEVVKHAKYVVTLDGVELRGGISRLRSRLERLGYAVVEDEEVYRIDPAGVGLWVPTGTKTIETVAVALYPGLPAAPPTSEAS
jgi:hypothetical protein